MFIWGRGKPAQFLPRWTIVGIILCTPAHKCSATCFHQTDQSPLMVPSDRKYYMLCYTFGDRHCWMSSNWRLSLDPKTEVMSMEDISRETTLSLCRTLTSPQVYNF